MISLLEKTFLTFLGDTIIVKDASNNKIRIRMEFIDAQEMAQQWGDDARNKLKF